MNTTTIAPAEYRRISLDGVCYYGKHLILSARCCNERLLQESAIAAFLKALVERIDMVAYGEPIVARFGGGIEVGISAVQLIETSAISLHTNDQARDLYLDVFSCKGYDDIEVVRFVEQYFGAKDISHQVLLRR